MRKLVILFSLVFAIAQLQWSAPAVDAQGWRLFSNKIKEEALEKGRELLFTFLNDICDNGSEANS